MASKTGIALLSMYDDEDDDMEDLNEEQEQEQEEQERGADEDMDDIKQGFPASVASPPVVEDNSTPEAVKFVSQINSSSLIVQRRSRRGTVTIVDYGHDEVAMSPEAEEGEIVSADGELQTANGNSQEETPGTVRVLSPSTQATSQSSEQLDISLTVTMNLTVRESEAAEVEDGHKIAEEALKDVDPLDTFLPSPPEERCSDELQDRINKFLALKRAGKSFNAEVRNKKDYRNPDFLLHAVRYQDIDQIGSCFSKDVFDPHGYDKSDYYDELEADVKREAERKEQERKKSQKVEFYAGGTQPGTVITAPKIGIPTPGVSTGGAGGFHSVPTAAEAVARDGRQNKKSKWDKVDGDQRISLPSGGKDSVSNVGAHAAILSAANAGAGYSAFAQQRRREAEEKRSSERRRS